MSQNTLITYSSVVPLLRLLIKIQNANVLVSININTNKRCVYNAGGSI